MGDVAAIGGTLRFCDEKVHIGIGIRSVNVRTLKYVYSLVGLLRLVREVWQG